MAKTKKKNRTQKRTELTKKLKSTDKKRVKKYSASGGECTFNSNEEDLNVKAIGFIFDNYLKNDDLKSLIYKFKEEMLFGDLSFKNKCELSEYLSKNSTLFQLIILSRSVGNHIENDDNNNANDNSSKMRLFEILCRSIVLYLGNDELYKTGKIKELLSLESLNSLNFLLDIVTYHMTDQEYEEHKEYLTSLITEEIEKVEAEERAKAEAVSEERANADLTEIAPDVSEENNNINSKNATHAPTATASAPPRRC
jgi:hypothetical protein